MKLTISDIARLAKVSKSSVSIVLNNKPGVSEETRKKILEIVNKYNYKPSHLAQSLVARKTKSIGLIISEIDNPFFTKVMKGVYDTCSNLGYSVLIGSSELSPAKEKESIENFISKRIDGMIISPLRGDGVDYQYLSSLINDNFPFVMLRNVENYAINLVDIDNSQASYEAVSYLIKNGHKRIAYFAGPEHSGHSMERINGYKRALMDNQININQDLIIRAGSYLLNGYQTGKEFLSNVENLPTAICCYNDLVAIGLISALEEKGIEVPDQVSVMGFDNIDFSAYIKKPLTTIHQPVYDIGKVATELLMEQLLQPDQFLNKKIILSSKLIERESCRKI